MASTAKENANPHIYNVNKERAHTRRTPLDWSQLGTFQTSSSTPTTAQDKTIFKALVDCSVATNGKGTNLLRQAGLNIPDYIKKDKDHVDAPLFHIVHTSHDAEDKAKSTIALPEKEDPQQSTGSAKREQISQENEESLTADEVFDIIRNIQDPEHPHTLEALGVVSLEQVELVNANNSTVAVNVRFTPTIPHCSMATLIGLCLRVKLHRSLSLGKFKVSVSIEPGTHVSEKAINKQLQDKERVCAALENRHLAGVVNKCIRQGMEQTT